MRVGFRGQKGNKYKSFLISKYVNAPTDLHTCRLLLTVTDRKPIDKL